jgi:hypothetical protein
LLTCLSFVLVRNDQAPDPRLVANAMLKALSYLENDFVVGLLVDFDASVLLFEVRAKDLKIK